MINSLLMVYENIRLQMRTYNHILLLCVVFNIRIMCRQRLQSEYRYAYIAYGCV